MKSVKLSSNLFFILLIIFSLSACTDLVVEEKDSIIIESSGEGFVAGDPTALLESSYKDLGAMTAQDNIYSLSAHTSDIMIPPTRGVDWGDNGVWRTLHAHTWDATHSFVTNSWNQLNQRAFKCNQIIASNPNPQQAAEAKFLRAFFTYQVMDLFGQVPFREVTEGVDVDPRVFTRTEAFDRVVKDLEEALPDLPESGPVAANSMATKAAANALLARLYINKAIYTATPAEGPYTFESADMDKVIEYADAVEASGYSLETDYFDNFRESATSEVIFTSAEGTPQNRWMMTLHYDQNPSGWNGFTTLADFYDTFEEDDSRLGYPASGDGEEFSGIGRGFLIGDQIKEDGSPLVDSRSDKVLSFTRDVPLAGAATDKGIRIVKYHPADNGQYILLRYADVLLMKAEALLRALTEQDMLDERGRELYWEGIRRTDQIRFGTFTSTWSSKTGTDAYRVLFPIPSLALSSNPNLQQNPGY